MSPISAGLDVIDAGQTNAVTSGDSGKRPIVGPDGDDVSNSEARHSVGAAISHTSRTVPGSALASHVRHVVVVRTQKKMGRIYARGHIALVANEKAVRDRPAMELP